MSFLIMRAALKSGVFYHRWLDSGDVRAPGEPVAAGADMLQAFYAVANDTPHVRHWIPTRETACVREAGDPPANVCVRLSAPFIGLRLKTESPNSMVLPKGAPVPDGVYPCPAPTQGNACVDCRACWDPSVRTVAYWAH